MKLITTRDITNDECDWITETIPDGTEVYSFSGITYGCITDEGIAVTMVEDEYPFFEVPSNAVKEI
jgi:hypothetical protein